MNYLVSRDPFTGGHTLIKDRARYAGLNSPALRRVNLTYHKAGEGVAAGGYTADMNNRAQAAVLAFGLPMIQQTGGSASFAGANAGNGQIINTVLNNVGLNTKITIEVSGTVNAADAETLRKTQFGLANLFSNIQLTDLSNYQRINTTGMHLSVLATLRRQWGFAAAFQNDSPVNLGSNFPVATQPAVVAGATLVPFRFFFEVPISYSDNDLRGAIYAGVTNATWRLQMTLNNAPIVGTGVDATYACWQSDTADVGQIKSLNVTVYQHYIDQLPRDGNGAPVVPLISIAHNYLIQRTQPSGLVVSQDFPVQYANFRDFLSTFCLFNNGGTLNTGSDVNYLGLQVANLSFIEKYDPYFSALKTRNIIGDDWPKGLYCIDHRRKPINTNQYGNMQFVLNTSQVNANAYLDMMYEMMALQSQAINAGSLASP